jgi:hypothetical protein
MVMAPYQSFQALYFLDTAGEAGHKKAQGYILGFVFVSGPDIPRDGERGGGKVIRRLRVGLNN